MAKFWRSGRRATDGQAAHQYCRLTYAHGHALPGLAAGAHAGIKLHIIAQSPDLRHRGCTVPNQRRAFDRSADLAVFDLIGLGAGKDELAIGNVHLTATNPTA